MKVTIDPDDRAQIERLLQLEGQAVAEIRAIQGGGGVLIADAFELALRRLADPNARLVVEEPLGLGAVVEDVEGNVFVRHVVIANAKPWRLTDQEWRSWDEIIPKQIHSYGVEYMTESFRPEGGAVSEKEATAVPSVWDGSVAPGGWVCSVCRMPTESEPCVDHQVAGQATS